KRTVQNRTPAAGSGFWPIGLPSGNSHQLQARIPLAKPFIAERPEGANRSSFIWPSGWPGAGASGTKSSGVFGYKAIGPCETRMKVAPVGDFENTKLHGGRDIIPRSRRSQCRSYVQAAKA